MGTAAELVAKAASQIGVKESPAGSNKVKYWDWYNEKTGVNLQGNPWCAAFVTWCMGETDIWSVTKDEGRFRYCPSLVNWAKENGQWRESSAKPQPGWIVLFANEKRACHVGIVEKRIDESQVQTIEGNTSVTSNDNGGSVMRRTRKYGKKGSSWYILGFIEPKFGSAGSSEAPKDLSKIVDEVIDGKWGNDPERSTKLEAAGYNSDEVRDAVNKKLGASSSSQKPVAKPSPVDSGLRTGRYTITAKSGLNVRTGPGIKYARKKKSELTANAQKNATEKGTLKKGTPMDVSKIAVEGTSRVWGEIPSGWVCLKENGKMYAKNG